MKKLTALLLALVMCFGLVACGGQTASTETTAAAAEATEPPAQETEAVESNFVDPVNGWDTYDALIEQIRTCTDPAARVELMHQAEDILMDTGALIPLFSQSDLYMQKSYLENVYCTPYGYKYFMFATLGEGAPSDSLRMYLASEPDKLDPALNSAVDGAILAINSFAGLFTYDADQKQVPDLAESYTVSDDGLTYTFTLKDDLKWSNGDTLDASDFVYSWNRAVDPATASDYAYMFAPIKGYAEMTEMDEEGNLVNPDATLAVTASEDGKTLTVELEYPTAYFLDLCAFPTYFPVYQEAVEAADPDGNNPGAWALEPGENFVCSGAYVLTEWNHNSSMVYEKNPNYHRADEVTIERQELMLTSDETTAFAAYNTGDLDFCDGVPTAEIPNQEGNPEFYVVETLGTGYISINVNSSLFDGYTPEEAATLRKAIGLFIDRDYICENVLQAGQVPAGSFIPAGCSDGNGGEFKNKDYFDPSYEAFEDNVAKGIEMMESIGFKFDENGMLSDETPLSFTYLVNTPGINVDVAEAIQSDMAAVGINMKLSPMEWNVFLNDRKNGNYDVARNAWLMDFNDPLNMLEMWTSDSGNNDCQFGRPQA